MRVGIISLGGESSQDIAKSCEKYFEKVDLLDLREFELHLTNEGIKVTHAKRDLEKYDCLYVRGSFRYALLQRSITRALSHEAFMPIEASAFTIGHDKFLTLVELQKKGVKIPKTFFAASTKQAIKVLENEVSFPVIMKVQEGTHGKGVLVADSLKSGRTILDILEQFKKPYIIQDFVPTKDTTDIRAIVVGKKVVAAYKRQAAQGEIRANVHSGGTRLPHELTEAEKQLALESAQAIGAGICGVDILNAEEPSVIEINLSPSIRPIKELLNIDASDAIARYLYNKTKKFIKSGKKIKKKKRKSNNGFN